MLWPRGALAPPRRRHAQIPEFLIRILGPAPCFGDSVAEDNQRVTWRHHLRFFLVNGIREEAKRGASHGEAPNGVVVHEYRTTLSRMAVTEATLGRHDADEQGYEPARNFAAAERTIQVPPWWRTRHRFLRPRSRARLARAPPGEPPVPPCRRRHRVPGETGRPRPDSRRSRRRRRGRDSPWPPNRCIDRCRATVATVGAGSGPRCEGPGQASQV